jgi:hypothetical protein
MFIWNLGARGNVAGWGTMIQAGRSWVRFPMRTLDFSLDLTLPAAPWPWGRLTLLTEMSTRKLPGSKERSARKTHNLTAICERIFYKMWEPLRLTTLRASTASYMDSLMFYLYMELEHSVFARARNWIYISPSATYPSSVQYMHSIIYAYVLQVVLFLEVLWLKVYLHFLHPHSCYMSNPSRFNYLNTW